MPERKIALPTLERYKRLFYEAKDVHNYKNHLKPQMMAFIKEGTDFQLVLREAMSHVPVKDSETLSCTDIAKNCLSKKPVEWVIKHVIEASAKSKIDNSQAIERIQADVQKAQAWSLKDGSVAEWMQSIREVASLQFRTDKVEKAVEVIRDNEKWIDSTMGLLNFAKRKTNTYEAMLSTLSDLKGNSDLPRKCIAALTVIKDSICSIQKAYSSGISLTELTKLV